jgi:mycothiol synthase
MTGTTTGGTTPSGDPDLDDLISRATAADGVPPFSDAALAAFARGERELVWERDADGNRVAAGLDSKDAAEFVVDPVHRGHGYGSRMLDMLTHPSRGGHGTAKLFWAHGDSAAAKVMMAHHKLEPVREVLHLRAPVPASASIPDGVSTATEADYDDILAVNARAFGDHPEQGQLTAESFDSLRREPWFDPANLLVLRGDDDRISGFVWLKVVDGDGEFYVVGVDPDRQRAGEGRALMNAGFARLATSGIHSSHLYVDETNTPALALYTSLGFERIGSDVQYHYAQ